MAQVDVGRALVEGVLPQPVHHLHHTLVVGVQGLAGLAQFHQLLEAGTSGVFTALGGCAHAARQRVELGGVAAQVIGIGHHQLDVAPGVGLDLADPRNVVGLGRGDDHFGRRHRHRQGVAALGVLHAHHVGHPAHVHPQGVDAQVGQLAAAGQPFGQVFGVQRLRAALAQQARAAQAHQRMQARGPGAEARGHALGVVGRDPAVFTQPAQQQRPFQLALGPRQGGGRCGRRRLGGFGGSGVHGFGERGTSAPGR